MSRACSTNVDEEKYIYVFDEKARRKETTTETKK
jgi:hypothetical protein